ncbi:hypothetical protein POUND7_014827 [Theobroma cacao]
MSATFIAYGMVKFLGNTFFTEQVNSMSGGSAIVGFQMIQWFSQISVKRGYNIVFEKRIERIKRRYSDGVKIGFGMLASIIRYAVASSVESKRYGETWLGDSINQSWLDSIYRAYAMLALLNCFLYAYVSTWYSYDNIIGRPEEEEEDIPFLEVNEEETAEGDQQNNQEQDVE